MSGWTCVRATSIGSNSNYISFVVKSIVTSWIKTIITRSKLNHIRFAITTIVISDNRIVVIRAENNLSTNNCTCFKMDIKRTTNSLYSKDSVSI
jgi:hypothetical protein